MSAIPPEAMPAVLEIRDKIRRPKNLPSLIKTGPRTHRLRWTHPVFLTPCCPLGLYPGAGSAEATSIYEIPSLDGACSIFWRWWDRQTDPKAAVEAVWGPE